MLANTVDHDGQAALEGGLCAGGGGFLVPILRRGLIYRQLPGVFTGAGPGFKSLLSLHGFGSALCLLARRAVVPDALDDEVVVPEAAFSVDRHFALSMYAATSSGSYRTTLSEIRMRGMPPSRTIARKVSCDTPSLWEACWMVSRAVMTDAAPLALCS